MIELPNGDWINPTSVVSIRTVQDNQHGTRVIIVASQHTEILVSFADQPSAKEWAHQFGLACQLVNQKLTYHDRTNPS